MADLSWMAPISIESIVSRGFLVPDGTRPSFTCLECARRCHRTPSPDSEGETGRTFTSCPKSRLRFEVKPHQLRVWTSGPQAIAAWLATELELAGTVRWLNADVAKLGERRSGRTRVSLFYVRSQRASSSPWLRLAHHIPQSSIVLRNGVEPLIDPLLPGRRVVSVQDLLGACEVGPELDTALVHTGFGPTLRHSTSGTIELPANARWSDLHMVVKDARTIAVTVGATSLSLTPESTGLVSDRGSSRAPRQEWRMLIDLAGTRGVLARHHRPGVSRLRQQVTRLRSALKRLFRISEDPIVSDGAAGGWKCSFEIRRWDDE